MKKLMPRLFSFQSPTSSPLPSPFRPVGEGGNCDSWQLVNVWQLRVNECHSLFSRTVYLNSKKQNKRNRPSSEETKKMTRFRGKNSHFVTFRVFHATICWGKTVTDLTSTTNIDKIGCNHYIIVNAIRLQNVINVVSNKVLCLRW